MDPRQNPYTPNAGARPPVLVGRDDQLENFDVLLHRLQNGYAEQSMLITGLRGVGKTVLLGAFETAAREQGWTTVETEVSKGFPFAARMATLVRRALLAIAPRRRWQERARKAAAVLQSFSLTFTSEGSVTFGLDVEAAEGLADSGNLSDDLTDLIVALGEAASERETGVVFLFDEVQFLARPELEALIAGLHKSVQRTLPITLVGAGLPQLPRLAGEAKSYAERLFRFPTIGSLDAEQARTALTEPARRLGIDFTAGAAARVVEYTEGYPYFIQEFGKTLWDTVDTPPLSEGHVEDCRELVEQKLDSSFFRVRADRATELELRYLRAMAERGGKPQPAGEVAELLGRTSAQMGPVRARLIDKGLLYTPSYGQAAFTVPQFDRYMRRRQPLEI